MVRGRRTRVTSAGPACRSPDVPLLGAELGTGSYDRRLAPWSAGSWQAPRHSTLSPAAPSRMS